VLDRLGLPRLRNEDRPFVAEDFVFEPSAFAATKGIDMVHEEVFLEETPLALLRQIDLQDRGRLHTSLALHLALCWDGFKDALTLLERFPSSFQRAFSLNALVNVADRYKIGDVGVAWAWSGDGEPDVLAFVRNNVYASFIGHDAAAVVRPAAQELRQLHTGGRYADQPAGVFADVRRRIGDAPRVPPGGRLELGPLLDTAARLFFITTSGSVNRSPERPESWYYRAGADRGRQEIVLFRVGRGILPVRERIAVDVQ
jgi:hypothetical protein